MSNNYVDRTSFVTQTYIVNRCRIWLGLACAACLLALPGRSAVLSWSGSGTTGNWNDIGNWGYAGVPANGDTLIFPASQPRPTNTNNLSSLTLNQIRFVGAGGGYNIWGNAFTLTDSLEATNSAGANTINNNITLSGATRPVNVASGVNLTLAGVLSGSAGLTKNGAGTLTLAGAFSNTYGGTTTVNAGLLELNKNGAPAATAIPGPLVIGGGASSATVRNLQPTEIADSANVTINANGLWDLNDWNETIGTVLTLNGGADVQTGTGTLTLSPNATVTFNPAPATGNSVISGKLNIGSSGTCHFEVGSVSGGGALIVSAVVSGSAAARKTGSGWMYLEGANTFTGSVSVEDGRLWSENSLALGAGAAGVTVSNSAQLFVLNNITISGKPLTLASTNSEGALYCYAQSNTWAGPITLAAPTFIYVPTNSSLVLTGAISGTGGLTQLGSGTLWFQGASANTYAGTTTVGGGTLLLGKTGGVVAVPDDLVISNKSTARCLANYQIYSPFKNITIYDAGVLDTTGFNEWVGLLTLQGARIFSGGAGTLYLGGDIIVIPSTNRVSTISGNAALWGGTKTVTNTDAYFWPDLVISANLSSDGSSGLIKTGPGYAALTASNSFAGPVTVNDGLLDIRNSFSLGTNMVTVNSGGTLYLYSGLAVGNKPLVLNGIGFAGLGALRAAATNSWAGNITLASDTWIDLYNASDDLTLSGAISGPGSMTKLGQGTLTYAGAGNNTYSGVTAVNEGTLVLNVSGNAFGGPLVIGDGSGSGDPVVRLARSTEIPNSVPVTINKGGLLDLDNFTDTISGLTLNQATVQTGAGTLALLSNSTITNTGNSTISGNLNIGSSGTCTLAGTNNLYLNANVNGAAGITKSGPGIFWLYGSNSYSGLTLVQQGILWAADPYALGSTSSGTVVSNGASLVLPAGIGVTNEALTLNGLGYSSSWGALDGENTGTNIWAGPITLNADSTIVPWSANTTLRIIGPINGPGGVIKMVNSAGTLMFEGTTANTYAGLTTVSAGTLLLNKPPSDWAVPNDLIINNATVRLLNHNQIANSADVTINSGGTLDLNNSYEGLGTINGSGNITLGTQFLNMYGNGTYTFDGVISGPGDFSQRGSGMLTLTATNTYTGGTFAVNGTMMINGSQPQSPVTVNSGATLSGSGVVGNVTCSGTLAPGASPAVLTASNLTFTSSGRYVVDLAGPSAGAGYDQLNVRGTNNLANAVLNLAPAFTSPPSIGSQFVIINNDGSDPITGTFSGLPNGSTISAGSFKFTIAYDGGGNDVVLTLADEPLAQAGWAVTAGNGNHTIDPNECNHLSLVITNKTGTAVTGIDAILTSADPNVLVTRSASAYADMPAWGKSTNSAAFQVSTLPSFLCGNDLNLNLTVATATYGTFTLPVVLKTGAPSTAPARYDINTATNIPDVGTIESTNTVSGFVGPLTKVAVSLWLTHPIDSDLNISLIAPDGTMVDLSSGNGSGANFGAGSSPDSSRTTFDDAAATSITAGSSPFAGVFRPEGSLASMLDSPANGGWRLRISDLYGGTVGTLRCWSLLLYPVACAPGGGACALCSTTITNTLTSSGGLQAGRLTRTGTISVCGALKPWPGSYDSNYRNFHAYAFYNGGTNACITVNLASNPGCDHFSAAYLGGFNPADLQQNYLAAPAASTGGSSVSYAFNVAADSVFVVTVNEVSTTLCGGPYTLTVSGSDCVPLLDIQPAGTGNVGVTWPVLVGGYQLESSSTISAPSWSPVTNEPCASNNRFNVTNNTSGSAKFYRLHKP